MPGPSYDCARGVVIHLAAAIRDQPPRTYEQIARLIAAAAGRHRPVVHLPLPLVRSGLIWLRRYFGEAVFATWEEAELMEVPMLTSRGAADVRELGVDPAPMSAVL